MIEAAPVPYRQDRAPWGWREILIVIFVTLVALVAVFTVLAFVIEALGLGDDAQDDPLGQTLLLLGQMLLDLAAVGAAAGFSLAKFKLPPAAWGLVRPPQIKFGVSFLVLVLCFVTLGLYAAVTKGLGLDAIDPESNVPRELFKHRSVVPLTVFLVLVIAPVAEEMFFRGFLFHGLWARYGFWVGAFSSGLLFSLIHVSGRDLLGLIVPFTIIGMLFAWLVRRTGSLWNAILVHFLFNAVGLTGTFAQVILR